MNRRVAALKSGVGRRDYWNDEEEAYLSLSLTLISRAIKLHPKCCAGRSFTTSNLSEHA